MDAFQDKLTEMRRAFHRDPELGFDEVRTKARVATYLRDLGLEVHEGVGVVGILRAGGGNRAIGVKFQPLTGPLYLVQLARFQAAGGKIAQGFKPCHLRILLHIADRAP